MKLAFANLITIIASFVLLFAVALAQPATSQGEGESHHASDQAQPSSGKSSGTAGTGMMGQGMMNGPGMMGGPHMMIEPNGMAPNGMLDMQLMQMMMHDPRTRGQMMQIHGRMMKEMGELMEKRGKELEQGK